MAKKLYGREVIAGPYPCRFPDIQVMRDGKYQIEIVVPIDEAQELNDMLYGGDVKLIDHNKASAKAKVPRKLYVPLYLYDEESKEPLYAEDGETRLESDTHVIFRYKTQFKPVIQFKKGLNKSAKIGAGSLVEISGALFGSSTVDDIGKPIDYCLLSLRGVRVHELVEPNHGEVFAPDDSFEDADEWEEPEEESETESADY